jgi:hypothetical protein
VRDSSGYEGQLLSFVDAVLRYVFLYLLHVRSDSLRFRSKMPSYAQDFLATLKLPLVSLKISLFRSNSLHGNKVYQTSLFIRSLKQRLFFLLGWIIQQHRLLLLIELHTQTIIHEVCCFLPLHKTLDIVCRGQVL